MQLKSEYLIQIHPVDYCSCHRKWNTRRCSNFFCPQWLDACKYFKLFLKLSQLNSDMYSHEELHRKTDSLQKRKFRRIYMLNFLGTKINFSWVCVNKHDLHLDLVFRAFFWLMVGNLLTSFLSIKLLLKNSFLLWFSSRQVTSLADKHRGVWDLATTVFCCFFCRWFHLSSMNFSFYLIWAAKLNKVGDIFQTSGCR